MWKDSVRQAASRSSLRNRLAQRPRQREEHRLVRRRQRLDSNLEPLCETVEHLFDQDLWGGGPGGDRERAHLRKYAPIDLIGAGDEQSDTAARALRYFAQAL